MTRAPIAVLLLTTIIPVLAHAADQTVLGKLASA